MKKFWLKVIFVRFAALPTSVWYPFQTLANAVFTAITASKPSFKWDLLIVINVNNKLKVLVCLVVIDYGIKH
jgi:hypothetical protein